MFIVFTIFSICFTFKQADNNGNIVSLNERLSNAATDNSRVSANGIFNSLPMIVFLFITNLNYIVNYISKLKIYNYQRKKIGN